MQANGRLEWIGIRPERRAPVLAVEKAVIEIGRGIVGDHYRPKRGGRREVTLIRAEHLPEIAERDGRSAVDPGLLRRNLVISGLPLADLIGRRLRVGGVELEVTGPCSPCSRMDEALGPGGRSAMSGRGGVTAIVIRGGEIHRGDTVESLPAASDTTCEQQSA